MVLKKVTKYEKCRNDIMNDYMKKFERDELIGKNKKVIKNRKQAIAIGISISDKRCNSKIGVKDIEKMEKKVCKLFEDDVGVLPIITLKRATYLLEYYKSNGKYAKNKKLKMALRKYIKKFEKKVIMNMERDIIKDMLEYLS